MACYIIGALWAYNSLLSIVPSEFGFFVFLLNLQFCPNLDSGIGIYVYPCVVPMHVQASSRHLYLPPLLSFLFLKVSELGFH